MLRKLGNSLGTLIFMIASGVGCLLALVLVLTLIGENYFGSYEHFLKYPALLFVPAFVAFLAPAFVPRWLRRQDAQRQRTQLLVARISVIAILVPIISSVPTVSGRHSSHLTLLFDSAHRLATEA